MSKKRCYFPSKIPNFPSILVLSQFLRLRFFLRAVRKSAQDSSICKRCKLTSKCLPYQAVRAPHWPAVWATAYSNLLERCQLLAPMSQWERVNIFSGGGDPNRTRELRAAAMAQAPRLPMRPLLSDRAVGAISSDGLWCVGHSVYT